MKSLRNYIPEMQAYNQRRNEAAEQLQTELSKAKDIYSADTYKGIAAKLQGEYESKYSADYSDLMRRLVGTADAEIRKIESAIEESRPADYALQLANLIKMIETLDEKTIHQHAETLSKAVRPFSYDQLARETLTQMLVKRNISVDFDNETPRVLDALKTAKGFANESWSDANFTTNYQWFLDSNFPEDKPQVATQFEFDFSYTANQIAKQRGL